MRTYLATAVLTLTCAAMAAPAPPAGASPTPRTAGTARVRVTGEVVPLIHEGPAAATTVGAQLLVDGRYVPVTGPAAASLPDHARVTVDVTVPAVVASAAARRDPLRLDVHGTTVDTHDLAPTDLASAIISPAPATSPLGAATVAAATSVSGQPLTITNVVAAAPAPPTPAVKVTRSITVVDVTPARLTPVRTTRSATRAQVAAADRYWRANTRGQIGLAAPTFRPGYRSRYSCARMASMIDEAVTHLDWTPRRDATLLLRLPVAAPGCHYGLGTLGASPRSAGVALITSDDWPVLAHEIGHNMSLGHANQLTCRPPRPDTPYTPYTPYLWGRSCTEAEYANRLDVMGASSRTGAGMLSAPAAITTGFLPKSATTRVTRSGRRQVTLAPMTATTGTRAVQVDTRSGDRYYLEYRTRAGYDADDTAAETHGVRVLRYNTQSSSSVLLDPHPSSGDDGDAALQIGQTFTSHNRELTVTVTAATTRSAALTLTLGSRATAVTPRPTITGTPKVGTVLRLDTTGWTAPGTLARIQWLRDGRPIRSATSARYTPTRADAGRYLTVRVTTTSPTAGTRETLTPRVGVPMVATTRPSITSGARGRLTARPGTWSSRPTSFTYQWHRDGAKVPGATSRTYPIRARDRGRALHVRVTAHRPGRVSGSATSRTTRPR